MSRSWSASPTRRIGDHPRHIRDFIMAMPNGTLTAAELCAAFRDRAAAVHDLVSYSFSQGLGVGEETLTDVVLVEMHRRLHPHVVTKKFTKHDENALSGADWLWTIGRPGRWLSLLVQAKLARPSKPSLAGLHHGRGSQRKTLVSYAAQETLWPLYVVYSAFSPPAPAAAAAVITAAKPTKKRRTPTPTWQPACPIAIEDIKQMGCVAVRPRQVALMDRSSKNREDVTTLMSRGHPWSCLFCCRPAAGSVDLADLVAAGIARLPIDHPHAKGPGGPGTAAPDDLFDSADTMITANPPPIVEALLAGRVIEHGEPDAPPVAAVMVISSEPLDAAQSMRRD